MNNTMNDPRQGWTSASSAEADTLCPGRHLAQKGIPEISSDAAEFGTQVHAAFQTGDDSSLEISQEWVTERARELEKEAVEIVFGNVQTRCMREHRFWDGTMQFKHSGQADVVHEAGDRALVLDLKSLRGTVAASPTNMQLRDLAVMVWSNLPDIHYVFVCIIQPMVKGKPVIVEYGKKDLHLSHKEMIERIKASNDPNSPRIPGELQCRYCKARAYPERCPEVHQWLVKSVPKGKDAVATLAPQALAEIWRKRNTITGILDAVTDRLKTLSDEELAALGLKKKPGVQREKIVKPNELYARLTEHGVTVQEYTAIVGVPKGKFQELVKAKTGLKGKSLEKLCDDLLAGLTETTVGQEQLEEIKE
jgi:hypothetical protein